jgi:HlyD family secretion protein
VKIQLADSTIPLKPEFSADIEIIVQEGLNVLMLPTHVILERERGKYVQIVADGRLQERPIRVGASNWDFTEVTAGLHEGDSVIIPGDGTKRDDGRPVHMVE